jgi:nonspecific dipeptidase
MTDLIYLMDALVDQQGIIQIPGMYDDVLPVTENERKMYRDIDFDVDEFRADVGCKRLLHAENKVCSYPF